MQTLRPFQSEALAALVEPGHLICIAPTGAGKSLIYEKIAQRAGARVLLVSPLVALARQQRDRLEAAGVKTWLTAGTSTERPSSPSEAGAWICSPESLQTSSRLQVLRAWGPQVLVVDECHCLWEWGEDFRPSFDLLPDLIQHLEIKRSLWLTATLPLPARRELLGRLPDKTRVVGHFDLPESLSLRVAKVPSADRAGALIRWALAQPDSGIVFTPTRETSERVARLLAATGIPATPYHAGMSSEERTAIEARVASGAHVVIAATSAFGMGMNFPHLRWAVLWQAPMSLLSLAQAVGRVGRSSSGKTSPGVALVFWDTDDFRTMEWALGKSARRRTEFLPTLRFLESQACRRAGLRLHFEPDLAQSENLACDRCDFCECFSIGKNE